ncbi:hypothetical protein NUACC21_63710 [Scytonema sp. NUACC21]
MGGVRELLGGVGELLGGVGELLGGVGEFDIKELQLIKKLTTFNLKDCLENGRVARRLFHSIISTQPYFHYLLIDI